VTALDPLQAHSVDAMAALCRRSMTDPPTADELEAVLFDRDRPALVRGDPEVGVVATGESGGAGFVKLLVVDPAHRRQGRGQALLAAAEADLAHTSSITVGTDAPYYLFPGVETNATALLCLLERRRYQRHDATLNMSIDLRGLPADPGGDAVRVAYPADRDDLVAWLKSHWLNWYDEALRAFEKGTLVIAEDDEGLSAMCAYDVNRRGHVGPVAVRPNLIGRGAGAAVLVRALHRMRATGHEQVEIAWVGPIVPYARLGAVVSRVFLVYRKELQPAP
jgi:GNAT superfamily N-acetyltransferase